MIGDGAELVPALDPGEDDVLERLATVAPRRVHLQVAVVVVDARAGQLLVPERGKDLRAAQEMAPQVAAPLDVAALAAFGDRSLDRRRGAGLQHLENHARRRRTDVWNLAERPV